MLGAPVSRAPTLQVYSRRTGVGEVRVDVVGEVDLATAHQLQTELEAADRVAMDGVIVGLQGVKFIDSIGLRALLEAQRAVHARGARFSVADPSAIVTRVFAIAGVEAMFETTNGG
jgi:anti-anti-sigma factor